LTDSIPLKAPRKGLAEDSIDVSLMKASAKGDDHAFQSLVERHQHAVIGTVYKMLGPASDAEDITQQVFLRLWKNASKYSPRAKFSTYLFTIVRNVVFTESKKATKRKTTSIDDSESKEILSLANKNDSNPDQAYAMAELQSAVDQAIADLPEDQRMVIILRRYENMPYEEIANVLETTTSAVKSHLFRARATLRNSLASFIEKAEAP